MHTHFISCPNNWTHRTLGYLVVTLKIASEDGRSHSCLDQKRPPKYLGLLLSNMLRPTFVPNLVVLTWTRASAALDWLTLPLSIKTTRPDPLTPHPTPTPPPPPPPSKFKPNSTAQSNRFSSCTSCVTPWNSLCSISVTWVSTHNY